MTFGNVRPLVLFAHGKESGPSGGKIRMLSKIAANLGWDAISPDYSDLDNPDARLARLFELPLPERSGFVMVGSSMGGYVSACASRVLRPNGLFLMAPAIGLSGYGDSSPIPVADKVVVVGGWHDDVVPSRNVMGYAESFGCDLHMFQAGHRLAEAHDELCVIFERLLVSVVGV